MLELSIKEQKKINGGRTLYIVMGYEDGKIVEQQETFSTDDVDRIRTKYLALRYWPIRVTSVTA